jgi:UDP-N-acetylglucosamine:LPS N-acetylglucosamine transferase
VIPAFVGKAMRGEPLTLAGDGGQSRRFVYVEDLADGVALGLGDVATNRVYNLASDENVTIKQIAERIKELMGDVEIVHTPARPGDFGGKIVCSRRAERELGWTAATPFAEGVRRYVEWRREQEASSAERQAAEVIPAGEPDAEAKPRQVLIISADIGEGHDLPARAVAREFADEDPDAQVSIVNGLPAMGPILTTVLRDNSAFMFRWVPWWFDFQYRLFMYFPPTRWLAKRLLTGLGRRGLMRLIRAHDPDLIVSTYPGVTTVLGELRRKGRLEVPCYSSITDLAGLRFWAHPGIDLHFLTHPESIEEVEHIAGPGSARWAKPPTAPAFLAARSRSDARRALGLPAEGKVIAVSGGGWGVGDLVGATGAALSVPDATVLCLCGRNDRLRARVSKRFAGEQRLRVMGFTDRMGDVLAASDALIHSSAGLTVLEALIRGCPVISYGFGYGHVRASNAALKRFGLAQVARKETELKPDLERALKHRPEPDGSFARRPSTASLILNDERRVRPLPAWRTRTARAVTTATAAIAVVAWMLTAGSSYRLVSHFVHMRPTTAVQTTLPEVGVLVDAPSSELQSVANALTVNRLRASFALEQPPSRIELGSLGSGDQAIPLLRSGGLVRWLGTRDQLHDVTGRMGFGRHFLYASNGPSVGQWWLAHGAGGELIAGAVRLDDTDDTIPELHAGQVVELTVSSRSDVEAVVRKLSIALQADRLQAVPVGRLLHDAGDAV